MLLQVTDATSSSSADVGVQATPSAVTADITPQKQQRGILPVTSVMRNSAAKDSLNHYDNQASTTNTKEKTPMCMVNELARFNKVSYLKFLGQVEGCARIGRV